MGFVPAVVHHWNAILIAAEVGRGASHPVAAVHKPARCKCPVTVDESGIAIVTLLHDHIPPVHLSGWTRDLACGPEATVHDSASAGTVEKHRVFDTTDRIEGWVWVTH